MSAPRIRCVDYRAFSKGFLKGFVTLELPSGLILPNCTHHENGGTEWIGVPGRPLIDPEGNLMRTDRGKPRYVQSIGFATEEIKSAFLSQALRGVREHLAQNAKAPQAGSVEGS